LNSEPQNIEQEMSNDEVWNHFALTILDLYKSIEYLTSTFIIPCSIFVIRLFKVSFSIKLAAFQAGGTARIIDQRCSQELRESGFHRLSISGLRRIERLKK